MSVYIGGCWKTSGLYSTNNTKSASLVCVCTMKGRGGKFVVGVLIQAQLIETFNEHWLNCVWVIDSQTPPVVRDSAVSAETYFSQHVKWLYNDLGARGAGGLEHLSLFAIAHNPVRVKLFYSYHGVICVNVHVCNFVCRSPTLISYQSVVDSLPIVYMCRAINYLTTH